MAWDPLRDLRTLQERLARPPAEAWAPPIDVYETASVYVVTAEVPGLTRELIELALEETRLTIRGRRPDPASTVGRAVRFHQLERGRGPFSRTFEFADRVDGARVSADLTNGVLTVTLPKLAEPPARTIEVG
ncbi:MAG: Hsp20/alpha crystallin family protein [Vicinamibacterales bacterium]